MAASFPHDNADTTGADGPPKHTLDESIVHLAFDLPQSLPYVTHLRRTCRCLMDSLRVMDADADDIELLIGELAANAARHAHNGGYHVDAQFFDSHAIVTVVDHGGGFSVEQVPQPGTLRTNDLFDQPEGRTGGFGLPLVHALADRVDIRSDPTQGTTVRVEKLFRLTSAPS